MISLINIDGLAVEFDPDSDFSSFSMTAYEQKKDETIQLGNCDFYIREKKGKRVCSIFDLRLIEPGLGNRSAQTATALLSLVEDVCVKRGVDAIEYFETPGKIKEADVIKFYKDKHYRTYPCKDGTIKISKDLNRKTSIGRGYASNLVPYFEPANSDEFGI